MEKGRFAHSSPSTDASVRRSVGIAKTVYRKLKTVNRKTGQFFRSNGTVTRNSAPSSLITSGGKLSR
ncbi:hypothetical protein GCM10027299_14730 [Larkinella ripae]